MRISPFPPTSWSTAIGISLLLVPASALVLLASPLPAHAIGTAVDLGTVASYSVLAGQAVSNTGSSVLESNVWVSPGTAISGFPPGITRGVAHAADAHALQAQADLATAYNDAAGQASDAAVGADLGGITLVPGVYTASSSTRITGPLTLDAGGDPRAVFIFQIGSALTTATSSSVVLLNDAQSCRDFWQVGSSATLGTDTTFVGTIMALTSITADTGATIEGRALARNGSVTLDTNAFTDPGCATTSTTPPATPTATPTATVTPIATVTPTASATSIATVTPTASATSTATVTPTASGSPTASATPTDTATSAPNVSTSATPTVPAPTPTQSSTSAAVAVGSSGGDSSNGQSIAYTGGGPPAPLVAIGLATILGGLAIVLIARRRPTTQPGTRFLR